MKCGATIGKESPSTFGTLLTASFIEAGKSVENKQEINVNELILLGKSAIDGIKKRGKAETGDKTMLDSLAPAVKTFEESLAKDGNLSQAFNAAVVASAEGMEATENMIAKHGRAARHKGAGAGVRDPGATAMYYIIKSFAKVQITSLAKVLDTDCGS